MEKHLAMHLELPLDSDLEKLSHMILNHMDKSVALVGRKYLFRNHLSTVTKMLDNYSRFQALHQMEYPISM